MAENASPWLETVRRVIEDLAASDVAEFELRQGDFRLRVRRRVSQLAAGPPRAPEPPEPAGLPILAPFTGVFYRASSPTAEPYVREGDWVEAGATIGLIETMKIFNEVTAEQAGRVEKILAATGQLVHAGEPLAILAPGEQAAEEVRPD